MTMFSTGKLFVVATPIGNLRDISARAVAVLHDVDLILCEDTRISRRLLDFHGIDNAVSSLHEYNEKRRATQLIRKLQDGCTLALISDAGTPTVSDPGRWFIAAVHEANIEVISIPGPSAIVTALAGGGVNADCFVFEGFLPSRRVARCSRLEQLRNETRTMVFYEAPHRIIAMLEDLELVFGGDRDVCLAKELTKKNERFVRDSLSHLRQWIEGDVKRCKGEFVVMVTGEPAAGENFELKVASLELLALLIKHLPARTAAGIVASLGGGKRNALYKMAVKMTHKGQV